VLADHTGTDSYKTSINNYWSHMETTVMPIEVYHL